MVALMLFILTSNKGIVIVETDRRKKIEPFTYLPFIARPRNCVGQHLALLESKIVVAMLWQQYKCAFDNKLQYQQHQQGRPSWQFLIVKILVMVAVVAIIIVAVRYFGMMIQDIGTCIRMDKQLVNHSEFHQLLKR
jgi:Cytochrome P450